MVRILIMAVDPYVREGLAAMLETEGEIEVCGQIGPVEYLQGKVDIYSPDLILVDSQDAPLADGNLMAVLTNSEWPLIILGSDNEPAESGWPPYASVLPRRANPRQLKAAIHAVEAGLQVIDREQDLRFHIQSDHSRNEYFDPLTERELEVIQKLAEGLTNKAIAQVLGISENTVKFHVNSLFQKLKAQSRTEAVVHAVQAGLLPL